MAQVHVNSQEQSRKPRFLGSARMSYTLCAFVMMALQLCMRNTINFVVLCMFDNPVEPAVDGVEYATEKVGNNSLGAPTASYANGETNTAASTVGWTRSQQFAIQGCFYYGYTIALPFAGFVADKLGGKLLFIASIVGQAIVFALFPVFSKLSYSAAFVSRIVQGLIAGTGNPCVYQLFGVWAHPSERTALVTFAYGGYAVGSLICFPLSGLFCKFGWETSFYVIGVVSCAIGLSFNWIIYNKLEDHPRLSAKQKEYLSECATQKPEEPLRVPWRSILTSVPIYVFMLTHTGSTYTIITFTMILPKMMDELFDFSIEETSLCASSLFLGLIFAKIIVFFGSKPVEKLSTQTRVRRSVYGISTVCAILFIVCVVFIIRVDVSAPFLFLISVFYIGLFADVAFSAYWPSLLFMAPPLVGLLSGIANCLAGLAGIGVPFVVSALTTTGTSTEWSNVIITVLSIYALTTVYCLFGSSELQPWAATPPKRDGEQN